MFYAEKGISLFDANIAFGISGKDPKLPAFLRSFYILENFPFDLSKLNERIKELNWSTRTEVKKRGFPETADDIRDKLTFINNSDNYGVIIITRRADRHWIFLCERIN